MLEALKTLISASEYSREELESIRDKFGPDWLVSRIPLPVGVLLCAYDEFEKVADELSELRAAAAVLTALESAGVDNWEGYDMALDMME